MRLTTRDSYDTTVCTRCGNHVGDAKFCQCGAPTAQASFAERTEYELEQYRAYKARQSA